jgi:circadian clock protein KaiB
VTGLNRASGLAIERVRDVCETNLLGRYELEVVDIYQKPSLARDEQILATPTLIKVLPAPLRRYIGNLANVERVLFGLDLREKR